MSKAKNLKDLINRSSGSREYFLSLPVPMQITIHALNERIRTAEELHRLVDFLEQTKRF